MLRSSSVIDTAAELVDSADGDEHADHARLDEPEAAGQERHGGEQRRDQRDEQELRRAEVDAGQVQREHHEPEARALRRPHQHGEAEQRGQSRERVDGAEAEALVAVEDRLREKAKDALTAAGAHHEDHADPGEADDARRSPRTG